MPKQTTKAIDRLDGDNIESGLMKLFRQTFANSNIIIQSTKGEKVIIHKLEQ